MVSAQKKDPPLQPAPAISSPKGGDGFGKVLGSIQGLQQRLDDFSLEEACDASEKARAIIEQLTSMQAQLALLAELRNVVAHTNRTVGEINVANFDSIASDKLDDHPQLRAIVQVGKVIHLHHALRASHADIEASSSGSDSSMLSPLNARAVAPSTFGLEPIAVTQSPEEKASIAPPKMNDTVLEGELLLAPDLTANRESPSPADAPGPQDGKPHSRYDSAGLKLDNSNDSGRNRSESRAAKRASDRVITEKKIDSAPNQHPFDERLLNDLIDTYGEFAGSSTSPRLIEAPAAIKVTIPSVENERLPAIPSFDLVPVNADPKEPLALPSPQDAEIPPPTVKTFIPNIKNRLEIDRQLKSIIKDYGEYDLYSRAKPSAFTKRTAAIAAFVVLGVVLGGFYFFKGPSPKSHISAESVQPVANGSTFPSDMKSPNQKTH